MYRQADYGTALSQMPYILFCGSRHARMYNAVYKLEAFEIINIKHRLM